MDDQSEQAQQAGVNSLQYWNYRFQHDWEARGGREQSKFFAMLMLDHLPKWLLSIIQKRRLSVCDWGCALGDGTSLLKEKFGDSDVCGIDFSSIAIENAKSKYPNVAFISRDLLSTPTTHKFDVMVASNVLEHFADPAKTMDGLAKLVKNFLIVLTPFQEENLIEEHQFSFQYSNISLAVVNRFVLIWAKVLDTTTYSPVHWHGRQILLIYASWDAIRKFDLTLEQTDVGELNAGIDQLSSVVEGFRNDLNDLRSSKAELESKLAAQTAATGAVERALTDLISAHAKLQSAEDQTLAQLGATQTEVQRLNRLNADIMSQWGATQSDIQVFRQQSADALAQLSAMQDEVEELRSDNTDALARLDIAQAESKYLRDHYGDLVMQNQQWAERIRALVAQNEQWAERIRAAASAFETVGAELSEVSVRIGELARSRIWRIAKAIRFLRTELLVGPWRRRISGARRLLLRIVRRVPLGLFDQLRFVNGIIDVASRRLAVELGALPTIADDRSGTMPVPERTKLRPSLTARRLGVARGERGLVSIVLPVYNHAGYLAEAIAGVLVQTYAAWELIVVDDGSTDDFDSAIAPFIDDRRIRVLRQPNQKLPSALNNGFAYARGEYLTWTSADNAMLPTQIERLVSALQTHPQAGLAYSDYEAIDDRGHPLQDASFRPHNREKQGGSLIRLPTASMANLHASGDNFIGASFLYRADVAAVVGRYDETAFGAEDYDYWLRMHLIAPFVHVDEVLYRYRVHVNTLNAAAKELDLYANVRQVLDRDAARRDALLASDDFSSSGTSHWRSGAQYQTIALDRDILTYSKLASGTVKAGPAARRPCVCVIDAPLRTLDVRQLRHVDVIVTSDEATFFWLKQQPLAASCRVLCAEFTMLEPVLDHVVALRGFERHEAADGHVVAAKPAATPLASMMSRRALVLVDEWRDGGVEQTILDLVGGLVDHEVDVTVGVARGVAPAELKAAAGSRGVKTMTFANDARRLQSFLADRRIEVVNLHHSIFGIEQAHAVGARTVYTAHNSYVWFEAAQRRTWSEALSRVDRVIAVSREVASYLTRHFGVDAGRLGVIPNGFDLPTLAEIDGNARSQSAPERSLRLINVATFNRVKMQVALIAAFSRFAATGRPAELTLIGFPADAAFLSEIKAQTTRLGLKERVTIVVGATHDDVIARLRQHDCFILPSLVEGWSIALTEAAVCGLPIIATDVGSARDLSMMGAAVELVPHPTGEVEFLDSGNLGQLVTDKNEPLVANLAAAMDTVWRDWDSMKQRAIGAAPHIAKTCSLQAMIEGYLKHAFMR